MKTKLSLLFLTAIAWLAAHPAAQAQPADGPAAEEQPATPAPQPVPVDDTVSVGGELRLLGRTADEALPEIMGLNPDVVLVTGDHSTPAKLNSHPWHELPVPYWGDHVRRDAVKAFGERPCMAGGLGHIRHVDLLPLAMAYAGHQFGNFVPQLGDGRAILLGEVTDSNGDSLGIHLKGSGPTLFSRNGDGRAALGPVLREYLVSEAMHKLGVPTTRATADRTRDGSSVGVRTKTRPSS